MARYRLVVLNSPVEGHEREYHEWYQNVHLPEVVSAEGFTVAQRFQIDFAISPGETWPYVAIYEIETDDIGKTMEAAKRSSSPPPPGIVAPGQYGVLYKEAGAPVRHEDLVKRRSS